MPDTVSETVVIANEYGVPRLLEMCERFYVDGVDVRFFCKF
jgi:hypothetical protein